MLIAIVGKPNSGKSTFFKAATLAEVAISPIPFTTIKPNEGVGFVRVRCPEIDFNVKCKPKHGFCLSGNRFVPVKMMDVAGLVPGAHLGKGLGNQFLSDLIQADVLIHIVDASGSTNEEGKFVESGSYDPCYDVHFVETEIDKWFTGLLKENWNKFVKQSQKKAVAKALAEQFYGFKITLEQVVFALKKTNLESKELTLWSDNDISQFATALRLLSKPVIIAANKIDLPAAKTNVEKLRKEFPNYLIVPVSAEAELALREAAKKELIKYIPGDSEFKILKPDELDEKKIKALTFIQEKILNIWGSTGLQQCLNSVVFDFLKYIAVFPVESAIKVSDSKGNILPDVHLLPPNSTAIDLAEKVHTDFAKNFVGAINARTRQKIGRDAKLQNLDVIEIISSH
ncbi:MAG: redox-regulated ATPase YchF [Candidatus Nanoarchaeia archaeon]